jgi:hypothetical protein
VGWQPSRFLTDRNEAERAFQLAERLGSVNAAAAELGTSWPSLRKAFQRHGLGIPTRNPEAVRQRAVDRRFNRRRYNAARTIELFSLRLRHQVDLDTLSVELLAAVDQTMQPTAASLWLRPSAQAPPTGEGRGRYPTNTLDSLHAV